MLLGQWHQTLAAGHRLPLPAAVRGSVMTGAVLTRGLDGGLWLLPPGAWEAMSARVGAMPFFHPARRQLERFLWSAAQPCQPDARGRIPISATLREWAGLAGEAVVVGANEFLEIWEPARWAEREGAALAGAPEALATLGW